MALMPLNLFVTHNGRSSRQHVTCRYKCGDASSKPVPNTSDNEYFGDIAKALSRRSVLQAGGIAVLAVGAGSALAACGRDAQPAATPTSSAAPAEAPPGMKFTAITPNSEDAVVIPEGYKQAVVISWGDPVLPNAPRFDVKAQTGAAQRGQFGFNNDYAGLLPIEGQPNHFLLVTNFEYVTPQFMFPGYDDKKPTREQFDIEIAAMGMGVVEVERTPQGLKPVMDADRLDRYGIPLEPSELLWETFDPRFDVTKTPNEANRFGYIVELNPWDPNSTPVKHTAMGRFRHEAANIYVTSDGTVVAYSGDDERFDYMYKFVSAKKVQPGSPNGADPTAMAHNLKLLDEGTLYVAKLSSDIPANEIDGSGKMPAKGTFSGTGTWLPLLRSGPNGQAESLVDGITAQEAAVFTRFAADKAGATKMDRPEDFEANPKTGKVYVTLTNNDERGAAGSTGPDAPNPRNDNKSGQILEITDNHAGTDFAWDLLLVCGDPAAADTYFAGFDKTKVSPISCPDNVAFDSHGNLWIATDGNALGSNDGLFAVALEGPNRGETKQFLTVPLGAETCGPVVTGDLVTVCVQHPGENDENSIDDPLSRWPEGGNGTARPSVVAVWKANGQIGV